MTSLTSGASTGTAPVRHAPEPGVHAPGRLAVVAAAVLLPLGPAAAAILRFIIPLEPVGESIAADPGAQRAVLWLGVVTLLTLVPGAYVAIALVRRPCPKLAGWIGVTLVPGYLAMSTLYGTDTAAMAGTDLGLGAPAIDRVVGAITSQPTSIVLLVTFVVGHITGSVLLGVAMMVGRVTPLAAGVTMIVSQPVHLVAVIVGSHVLDLIGGGLTALAMAALARAAVRLAAPKPTVQTAV